MCETMYDAPGVGLAATQVGIALRLAVMDCSEDKRTPQSIVIINPEILDPAERIEMEEGLLSVPGLVDKVQRYNQFKIRALHHQAHHVDPAADGRHEQEGQYENSHQD